MKGTRYSHDPKATQLQHQCYCVFMTTHFVNVGPSAVVACKTVDLVSIPQGASLCATFEDSLWIQVLCSMRVPGEGGLRQQDVIAGPECKRNLCIHSHAEKVYPLGNEEPLQECLAQLCPPASDTSLLGWLCVSVCVLGVRLQCLSDKWGSIKGAKRKWIFSGTAKVNIWMIHSRKISSDTHTPTQIR